ncbi:MAG: site-specific DNA-methyltransferase [Oscillibacter sp.]|nr:site-specific DNA-methyltransferase [Oscillibacter sp.]
MAEKIDGLTMDLEATNKDKLRAVFPECFTEGRLDIDKLLSLCGEYITDDFEKYEFKWKGKSDCLRLAQKRSTATLRPVPEDSVNWDTTQNLYIEGDNLEVLKLLQKSYFRKVKMIYIDPPYNTGNDFVYEDNFADPLTRYKEVTAQTTKSNPETMGRYHTKWLNMMYPRLRLAANLLRDDGVIFISIDDNEVVNLRKICDEVFGEENFIGILAVNASPSAIDYGHLAKMHDYALLYAKCISETITNQVPEKEKEFRFSDELGGFNIYPLYNGNVAFNPQTRPNLYYPFYLNPNSKLDNDFYEIKLSSEDGWEEVWPVVSQKDHIPHVWRWGKDKSSQNLNTEIVGYKNEDGEYRIVQKSRLFAKTIRSLLLDNSMASRQGTAEVQDLFEKKIFPFPKPIELLKLFIQVGTNSDSIVLDFFSGCATTAHAVMQLNAEDGGSRRFIMVQLPEVCDEKSTAARNGYSNICEIGKERIRRAGKKLAESGKGLDVGFKVFRLDSSNLKLWDDTPIENGDLGSLFARMSGIIDNLKPDRSEDDLVYEILLKMGYPLTADVTALDVDGLTVYTVEQNSMLICLQPGVTAELVEKMAALEPQKIVLAETAFVDNSVMSNAHYLLENRGIELKII